MSEELREWDAPEDCAPDEPFDEPLFGEPQPVMNADGLLPCPFCGSHAVISAREYGQCNITCSKGSCFIKNDLWFCTEAEAVKAWNTRYERTCHMVEQPDGYGSYDYVCSECGAFDNGTPYCWNCGAKVVEE